MLNTLSDRGKYVDTKLYLYEILWLFFKIIIITTIFAIAAFRFKLLVTFTVCFNIRCRYGDNLCIFIDVDIEFSLGRSMLNFAH